MIQVIRRARHAAPSLGNKHTIKSSCAARSSGDNTLEAMHDLSGLDLRSEGRPDILKRSFQAIIHGGERANPHLVEAAETTEGLRERGPPERSSRLHPVMRVRVVVVAEESLEDADR